MRPRALFVVSLLAAVFLTACGGGSSAKVSAQPPIFSSTPPTAAAQDTAYSYSVSATDPSGGTVTFALTTGPTGAALSGSSLSWTPAAAQSRTSNSFTITATTSEGGSATQSWSVSPTGTVTVNWVDTFWEAGGPVQRPITPSASFHISAIIPQTDGSITVLPGANSAPGVITISGVPAGYYWLSFGNTLTSLPARAFWTSTSTFDAGRDIAGSPLPTLATTGQTNFDFNLSGLDSVSSPSYVNFYPGTQVILPYFADPANSDALTVDIGIASNIDWSQIHNADLLQYEPFSLGPWNSLVLGPSAQLSNLTFTDGATNTITATLQPSSTQAFDMNVLGSQWNNLFTGAAPAAPSSYLSGWSLGAEPYVVGMDAPVELARLVLGGTTLQASGLGFAVQPFGACDGNGFFLLPGNTQPAILTDQDLGTLTYGDPFDPFWTRVFIFCEEAVIPIPLPNSSSTQDFALLNGLRVAPSSTAVAPQVGAVQSATINGASLFTAATVNTVSPTLSWSAPSGTAPIGYDVQVYVAGALPSGPTVYLRAGEFSTAKTSLTLVPLSGGNTYVFSITAIVNGAANMETNPYRSALPTGFSNVVSAPITISAAAAKARIHGDARVIQRLSQPTAIPTAKDREVTIRVIR